MCCVEVSPTGASFEYPNGFVILDWKIPKEAYEANLVIDLVKYERLPFTDAFVELHYLQFRPRRHSCCTVSDTAFLRSPSAVKRSRLSFKPAQSVQAQLIV